MKSGRSGLGSRCDLLTAPIFCSLRRRAVGSTGRNFSASSAPLPNLRAYRERNDTLTF